MARDEHGRFVSRAEITFKEDRVVEETLETAAEKLLEWLSGLDPQWKERIEVAQIERKWNKVQCVGQLCAYTLDQNAHLVAPQHPAFEPGYQPSGAEGLCPTCGRAFKLRYPGQPYCSNACYFASQKQLELPIEKPAA